MPAFGDLQVGTLFYYQDHLGEWSLYVKTFSMKGNAHFVNCDRVGCKFACWISDRVECDTKLRVKDGRLVLKEEAHPIIEKFMDLYYTGVGRSHWIVGAKVFGEELHVNTRGNPPTNVTSQIPSVFDKFKIVLCPKFLSHGQDYAAPEAFG